MSDENKVDSKQELLKKADQLRLGGSYEESRTLYQKVIKQNPFLALAKLGLGRVYFESGDLTNARLVLEEFAEFVPDHALANKILAKIYIHFNENGKARAKLESVLQVTASDSTAKKMLALLDEDKTDIEKFSDADTQKTVAPVKTVTIAEIYRSQGHLNEALEIYKELLKSDPENSDYQTRIDEIELQLQPTDIVVPSMDMPTAEHNGESETTAPQFEISEPINFVRHVEEEKPVEVEVQSPFDDELKQEITIDALEASMAQPEPASNYPSGVDLEESNEKTEYDDRTEIEDKTELDDRTELDGPSEISFSSFPILDTDSDSEPATLAPMLDPRLEKLENLLRIVQQNRRG